jgi:hypothetical protein
MTIDKITIQSFYRLWIILTIVGYFLCLFFSASLVVAFADLLSFLPFSYSLQHIIANMAMATFIGGVIGSLQLVALRIAINIGITWALANITGFFVSAGLLEIVFYAFKIPENLPYPLSVLPWVIAFTAAGGLSGILQQRILRHRVHSSGWWVLASAAGWGLGTGCLVMSYDFFFKEQRAAGLALLLVSPVVFGIITAAILVWMMRRPVQQT